MDNDRNSNQSDFESQHHYNNYLEYILSMVGFTVGFGSFWRFPYLLYKNGGGVFLIPYFLALFFVGIPLIYLQAAVGQMHQKSIPFIFSSINRGLKMLGVTFILIAFNISGYYNVILAYSYRFLFSAFLNPLPFAEQSPTENTYFTKSILHKSLSINNFDGINIPLFLLFIVSILVCYFVVKNGVKASGKIIIVTALLPYFFFFVLGIRALFLDGAGSGLKYLFQPKWGKLFRGQIWIDAIGQVFFQTSIACSAIINLSSLKPKKQSFIQSIYIIPTSIVICGLLCAMNVFMYLGHFSLILGVQIDNLHLSGLELSFNIFPKALAILPWPNLWVFLFFITLIFLGVDTQFGFLQTIFCYLKDQTKTMNGIEILGYQLSFQQIKKYVVIAIILIFCPLLTSYAGIHYMGFFDTFTTSIPLSLGALIQLKIFIYYLSFDELQRETQRCANTIAPKWIQYLLEGKFLLCVLVGNLVLAIINQILKFQEYTFGFYIFGWMITVYPYVLAYLYWMSNKQDTNRLTFDQLRIRKSYL